MCVCAGERKREKDRETWCYICHTHVCTHVCITPPSSSVSGYVEKKKRERESERERERECNMYRIELCIYCCRL